ncbi:hypothetical protein KDK_19370 [Dictyobacter kobayashii]|uniref:Uncharacterized protein n=1 Tax=Dictyobacter kobayashii TaxID=2014872 RepID=A0A402AG95_9CHLR|nr:hypothetical protein KDK_19370 [Dictyobacter kobayashii]
MAREPTERVFQWANLLVPAFVVWALNVQVPLVARAAVAVGPV